MTLFDSTNEIITYVTFGWMEQNKNENGLKQNGHFIIMFDAIRNGMDIPFYFYVWYNKIMQKLNKKINYNNTLIIK